MEIKFENNFHDVAMQLDQVYHKDIPFAAALALTRLAKDAQEKVRAGLSKEFTIRTPWVSRGIQIKTANKRDWPEMTAEVGTRDEFMLLQEIGGTKVAKQRTMAVPLAMRRDKKTVLTKSMWPGRLAKTNSNVIIQKIETRSGPTDAVLERTGNDDKPFKVLYLLKKSVRIKKRWNFVETIETYTSKAYDKEFGKALGEIIAKE